MDLALPPPRRQHSRRLRTKLRISEFQQLGFPYEIRWTGDATADAQEQSLERFLAEVVDPRGRRLGGGPDVAFVFARRGSATEDDRAPSESLVGNGPGINHQTGSLLQDAWYEAPR